MTDATPGNHGAPAPAGTPAAALLPPAAPPPTPPPPPAPPRDVTPAASRRAWREPRVHFWWILALGLVGGALWLGATQALAWNRDARLIRNGTRVDAVVWLAGAKVKGRPIRPEDLMNLEFVLNGQPVTHAGQRLVGRDQPTHSGDAIPVYVDPDDPRNWTARAAPPPLVRLLSGAIALACLAAALVGVGLLKRRGVLAAWRGGDARHAVVVETAHAALAPRSRLVRCALTDGSDKRLISVYVPHRVARLQRGDGLWIVMPPGRPDKALAAAAFGA